MTAWPDDGKMRQKKHTGLSVATLLSRVTKSHR